MRTEAPSHITYPNQSGGIVCWESPIATIDNHLNENPQEFIPRDVETCLALKMREGQIAFKALKGMSHPLATEYVGQCSRLAVFKYSSVQDATPPNTQSA